MMTSKEKNFASAVIYVHNAEAKLELFVKTIISVMENNFEHSEIICVNDFSTDESLNKIKEVSKLAKTTSLSVVNMSYFHGLEMAMNAGVDLSIGDFVFEFDDSYLDFNIDVIMEVYRKTLEGFDIVSAVPKRKMRLSSEIFYKVFNKFADVQGNMMTESFRVLSRRVINRISSMNIITPYRKAVYANSGLKTAHIKYDVTESLRGEQDSKEKSYRSTLAINSLVLFTDLGYRFSKGMSITMIIMTLLVIIYSIVAFVISKPVEGWTSTILFLSISFFGLFVILTVIIKYLQILVELIFRRKHYSFESIEKLTK